MFFSKMTQFLFFSSTFSPVLSCPVWAQILSLRISLRIFFYWKSSLASFLPYVIYSTYILNLTISKITKYLCLIVFSSAPLKTLVRQEVVVSSYLTYSHSGHILPECICCFFSQSKKFCHIELIHFLKICKLSVYVILIYF